ncbi:MAG: glycerate kinase [Bacteroidales bacterium]|nr:glycerate kinase [Bacteroidales bacterium]
MNHIGKVVICPDKFKGGLSSDKVASAIREGLERHFPDTVEILTVEMADGGDGSAALFGKLSGARKIELSACGPLGENVETSYMFCDGPSALSSGPSAFIECARICGLAMVPEDLRNPLNTTTFGLGELVLDAVRRGAETVCIGLGGSATNDCGTGMLQGMGFRPGLPSGVKATGGTLSQIASVEEMDDEGLKEKLSRTRFIIINDVDNPLLGPLGATYVYSGQKGADRESMDSMEKDMEGLLGRMGNSFLSRASAGEDALCPGAGAAGGLGFAFRHFLGADSVSGFDFFGEKLQGLSSKIAEADIVITGEGSADSQSLMGKVVGGVCKALYSAPRGKKKALMLLCGVSSLTPNELKAASGTDAVVIKQLSEIEPDIKKRVGFETPLLEKAAILAAEDLGASF